MNISYYFAQRNWITNQVIHRSMIWIISTLIVFLCLNYSSVFAQSADTKVIGKLVDAQSGEDIIGANIFFEGTTIGAASDLDGIFIISDVPPGNYTLIVQMISYAVLKITDFKLEAGETRRLDLALQPEELTTEEIVVEARMINNNEASLLKARQKSITVSDAVSSESISRSGGSDAADAMKKVTGASVVDGKYVYVRGLGDRYNSTMLNGAELPSMDPDKKSFQMDLIPSNLLDNIVTKKTFTPDEPGNFSGGIVDIGTKIYPDEFTIKFNAGGSYVANTTTRSDFLTYPGGSQDWLGMDDGTRQIPSLVQDPTVHIPSPNSARRDVDQALFLDDVSHSFNTTMAPTQKTAPIDQNYAFSIGNNVNLFGRQLGYFGSISYSRRFTSYENGSTGRWLLSGNTNEVDELKKDLYLDDSKGSEEVLWGALFSLSYKPHISHEISGNYLRTQSGTSEARYQYGEWPDQLSDGPIYETRSLLYTERNLSSYQLKGQHYLKSLFGTTAEWMVTYSSTLQDEPDLRFFSNDYRTEDKGGTIDTLYSINNSLYNNPTRFWRDLNEDNINSHLSLAIPFKPWNHLEGRIKLGGSYLKIDRQFRERRFEFRQQIGESYEGEPEAFFSAQNIGLIDSTNGRYYFANYISDQTTLRSNYDGDQKIYASFAMVEFPLHRTLKMVGGVRFEATRMAIVSQDSAAPTGNLNTDDWLPSLSLIQNLNDQMNVRIAYGKTLARPTFREMAPFTTFEFIGDYLYEGNALLQRTLIDNLDLRWEWFMRPGEILALSTYYKRFTNPIERTVNPETKTIRYQNVEKGQVYGIELELKKNLYELGPILRYFDLGANLSFIHSRVDIAQDEYDLIQRFDPGASKFRPLFGQSPYIVNLELGFHHNSSGTTANLYYNVAGQRLSEVTLGAAPDVYEQPFHQLDLTFKQRIWRALDLNFAVKNILADTVKKSQNFKGQEYLYQEYQLGRKFSFGLSYSL